MNGESNHSELESELKARETTNTQLLVNDLVSLSFIVGTMENKFMYVVPSFYDTYYL